MLSSARGDHRLSGAGRYLACQHRGRQGEIVCVAGANGAGKSTLLKIDLRRRASALRHHHLRRRADRGMAQHLITARGIAFVPENRRLFPRLSVRDNLRLGSYLYRGRRTAIAARAGVRAVSATVGTARTTRRNAVAAASSKCWQSAGR